MSDVEIRVLYQDDALLVCRKPTGVSSEEGGMGRLLAGQGLGTCYCVHRLDKGVGGLMVYARNARAAASLSAAIARGDFHKEYLAVVQGRPTDVQGMMEDLLYHDAQRNKSFVVKRQRRGVKEARLRYELLESIVFEDRELSLMRVELLTGRSHQIRVQFASRGMPLLGDACYGSSFRDCEIALYAAALRFAHPVGQRELSFNDNPPDSFPWGLFGLHNS